MLSSNAQLDSDPDKKSENQLTTVTVNPTQLVSSPKDFRFWMIFVAICVSIFLAALELTAVSTALPTIAHDLDAQDFIWVASAYTLSSTALLPASGGMAEVFGRRMTLLLTLGLFSLGSALCGAAQSMNWLIAARTLQGAGGGGISAVSSIILSDLVPLKERGVYNAAIALAWAAAAGIGPVVGGALAGAGQWRWLFYLNLPVAGFAAILVLAFLNLRTPRGSFKDKIKRMDWFGNFLVIASTTACLIGLTWGGVKFPWISAQVLAPLIIGLAGVCGFLFYEATIAKEPVVPFAILSNRTSLSGYIQTSMIGITTITYSYYLPVYFQACKDASPVRSGVDVLGLCLPLGPILILSGLSVKITKKYRPQLWLGWTVALIAAGTMTTVKSTTSIAATIGFTVFQAVGAGMIYPTVVFPILSSLPVSETAHALSFQNFIRTFASVWGVTIGTAVLQTQLKQKLPPAFIEQFPRGVAIAYSSIPVIPTLPEPLKSQVQAAFAESLSIVWKVIIGVVGIGALASLAMKALPLHTEIDEKWGLEERIGDSGHPEPSNP